MIVLTAEQAAALCALGEAEQDDPMPDTPEWQAGYRLAVDGAARELDPVRLVDLATATTEELMVMVAHPEPTFEHLCGFASGCAAVYRQIEAQWDRARGVRPARA